MANKQDWQPPAGWGSARLRGRLGQRRPGGRVAWQTSAGWHWSPTAPRVSPAATLAAGSRGFGVPAGRRSSRKCGQRRAGRSTGQGSGAHTLSPNRCVLPDIPPQLLVSRKRPMRSLSRRLEAGVTLQLRRMSLLLQGPSRACPGAPGLASFPLPAPCHCSRLVASPVLSCLASGPKGTSSPTAAWLRFPRCQTCSHWSRSRVQETCGLNFRTTQTCSVALGKPLSLSEPVSSLLTGKLSPYWALLFKGKAGA